MHYIYYCIFFIPCINTEYSSIEDRKQHYFSMDYGWFTYLPLEI